VAFALGKRCNDMSNFLVSQIIKFPNIEGVILNFQFGKTLRDGSKHALGLMPNMEKPALCPVRAIEKLIAFYRTNNILVGGGRLFVKLVNGVRGTEALSTDYMNSRFQRYLEQAAIRIDSAFFEIRGFDF
jgi:hypothetical protein